MTMAGEIRSKIFLLRFALPDDLVQQVNVLSEGFASHRCESAGGQRTVVLVRFGYGHKTFLLQGADVGGEIAVGHVQQAAQLREGEFGSGSQCRHDRQPPFFMDHSVELGEKIRIHVVGAFCSVK